MHLELIALVEVSGDHDLHVHRKHDFDVAGLGDRELRSELDHIVH